MPKQTKNVKPPSVSKPCLVPACPRLYVTRDPNKVCARGLCGPCYQAARRMVLVKETTWRELEDLGLADPPQRKFKETTTLFQTEYRRRKAAAANETATDENDHDQEAS